VTDDHARPVAHAVVALWRADREVARVVTSERGTFRFSDAARGAADAVIVRALGYRAHSSPLAARDTSLLVLPLQRLPRPLATVVVTTAEPGCRAPEDTNARSVWERMRARYQPEPVGVGRLAQLALRTGETDGDGVGILDEDVLVPGGWYRAAQVVDGLMASVDGGSYATRRPKGEVSERYGQVYDGWYYANVHELYPAHFLASAFANRHHLHLTTFADGAMELAFCGIDQRRPSLRGVLSLARDTTLVRAEWTWITPPPHEHARAMVEYAPPSVAGAPTYLVPVRSLFWRMAAVGGGRYWQDARVYRTWLHVNYEPALLR
jgi:hypothetical protein